MKHQAHITYNRDKPIMQHKVHISTSKTELNNQIKKCIIKQQQL